MGRVRDRNREADADLARLRSEYDAEKGGYTIPIKYTGRASINSRNKPQSKFVKSSYTPEQGGYYADKSLLKDPSKAYKARTRYSSGNPYLYYNPERAGYITGSQPGSRKGSAGRDKEIKDAAIARKVAATPHKRVNQTIRQNRGNARRERALRKGRQGTILSGTLGGTGEDDRKRKKTLLG